MHGDAAPVSLSRWFGGTFSRLSERTTLILLIVWCPETESNRHVLLGTRDFKSRASASFAIRAMLLLNSTAPTVAHRFILRAVGVSSQIKNRICSMFCRRA